MDGTALFNSTESSTFELTSASGYTIVSFYVQTFNCKSVSVYMYNDAGKRRLRDTVSTDFHFVHSISSFCNIMP